ncbi:hypothetical protein [Sphingomonas aerolata]|uniref:hypothetical protein n=1 Tax=Sphingomonas aerolata TaxID=185951 RepID=UPI0033503337
MALVSFRETATLITTLAVGSSLATSIQNADVIALVNGGNSIVTELIGPPGVQGVQGEPGQQGVQGIDGRDGSILGVNIDGGNAGSRYGGTTKIDGGRA